jgi:hypothetical protein
MDEFIPNFNDSPDDYESEDGNFARRSWFSFSPLGLIKKIAGVSSGNSVDYFFALTEL